VLNELLCNISVNSDSFSASLPSHPTRQRHTMFIVAFGLNATTSNPAAWQVSYTLRESNT
jgi:hypothetical protein